MGDPLSMNVSQFDDGNSLHPPPPQNGGSPKTCKATPSVWQRGAIGGRRCLALVAAILLLPGLLRGWADGGRRPNVLVVIADQWRPQAFGFAGDPNVKTPNFDALARSSVRCVNAVSGMPVCSPTRASFLTGQRPLTHGVFINDVPLDPQAVTIGKTLRAANYETGFIGKWHLDGHGRLSFIPPERRQGFDYWKVCECTHNYTDSIYYGDSPEKAHWSGYDAIDQTKDAVQYLRAHAKA